MSQRPHRRSRADQDDDAERAPRRSAKKDNNTAVVAGAIFVFALVAIGAAGWLNRGKTAKASDAPAPKTVDDLMQEKSPFAGIEAEQAPTRYSPGGQRVETTNRAPEEILQTPLWLDAQKKMEGAYALVKEAEEAKQAGDNDTYLDKAVTARGIIDEAIIATADWEMELQDEYGENDILVKKIVRERSRWFDQLRKYHGLRRD